MATSNELHPDHAQIRQQIETLIEALEAKDLEAVRQLYTTDIVSFDIEPPLHHVGIAAKLDNWVRAFQVFETIIYDIRDLTLTVGGDVAFGHAFARLRGTLADGTSTDGMWVRATFGMRKIDDTWLIAHDQVSVPLDIAGGRALTDLTP
ncbi:YybH family protein [Nocardia cyriacigeorgica]|uniref:YybH family protein n=1 Tax=Nocardia cyriacigeorgica TaxID=135487 RepID=UPI001895896B|nr:nuclear transport factor 2 family protein [Nocardia cyriacigeorgica]MBF6435066.1 nuclear transport factor 2 family protein [Nocardia cyriacigeorgica]